MEAQESGFVLGLGEVLESYPLQRACIWRDRSSLRLDREKSDIGVRKSMYSLEMERKDGERRGFVRKRAGGQAVWSLLCPYCNA